MYIYIYVYVYRRWEDSACKSFAKELYCSVIRRYTHSCKCVCICTRAYKQGGSMARAAGKRADKLYSASRLSLRVVLAWSPFWVVSLMTTTRHFIVCCSVLQCVAVCCSVLQCVAVCCSVLQCATVCCSVLQCVALCCSVLQCVAALSTSSAKEMYLLGQIDDDY